MNILNCRGLQKPILSSFQSIRMVQIEKKIEELGYVLPPLSTPKGNYRSAVRSGNLIFTAGHLPQQSNGELMKGKVGENVSPEDAYHAAHLASLSIIRTLKEEVGDLDRVKRIVKLVGFVNCVDGFENQPSVINGASDTFGKVFGDKGTHARSAVGTNALPLNIPVEVEAIVEISD